MPRAKIYGFIACVFSLLTGAIFFYHGFIFTGYLSGDYLHNLSNYTFYSIAIPISLIALSFLGTGFWVGWTILTIKAVPPMPELVERKDYSKIKAVLLCISTMVLAILFLYGIYKKSYWALAVPAAAVTLIVLGMIFWVGIAILTARSTLPKDKNKTAKIKD